MFTGEAAHELQHIGIKLQIAGNRPTNTVFPS